MQSMALPTMDWRAFRQALGRLALEVQPDFLFDNLPLASRQDRLFLEARALNPEQLVRSLLGQERILSISGRKRGREPIPSPEP
jgi:hypothetical protein